MIYLAIDCVPTAPSTTPEHSNRGGGTGVKEPERVLKVPYWQWKALFVGVKEVSKNISKAQENNIVSQCAGKEGPY